ncbi:hypothetical protein K3N28_12325 [Glycomyces sp. TRM65418]|uniref:hypothetical protein n=1 Tax=Glycomyces sp. TRM65418 TaxID=2867006 RepID=UPI001CE556A3|nr:hypothetical protein [Glycomyces sp. TRM65418]MCC3763852.1 hypothetical protein [Glycomyces sp. TRM65418]QZD53556.1 hypothetical protein K3N28_12255 [Glycomyces sp. TRM65418]
MSDRNNGTGNVYGGGTYQGGTYQSGAYRSGRHSDDEDERQGGDRPRPVDDEDAGTVKVARSGSTGSISPQQPPSAPSSPATSSPQTPAYGQPGHTGPQSPAYGAPGEAASARQGRPSAPQGQAPQPPISARGGAQPPRPAQQPGQPQHQTPRPPEMRPTVPPAGGQPQPSSPPQLQQQPPRPAAPPPTSPPAAQPPAGRPPAVRPSVQPPATPPVAQPPAPQGPPSPQSQPPYQLPGQSPSQPPPPSVAPVSAAPVSAPSISPVSAQPVSGQPVSGQPMSGGPVSGQPYSAQPASAQPYSGMPYSGAAPITGGPISSLPTSAGLFGVSQVSAGPTEGTVYGLPVTDRAVETASDAGRPIEAVRPAPQIPTARALELMTSASPPSGLVIGRDAEQVPVVAPFFRPEETRINLIGGVYLARLLVFRALAIGTRVAVCTTRPQEWNGLGETATGRNDRLAVLHGDQPVTVEASQHSPALYVYDVGERGSQTKPVLGPWRTQLTVLPRLTNYADDLTGEAHMTVLQRLTAEEAQIARSAIRVNQEVLQWLQMLHDDMIAMLRKGQKERYLWCAPTSIEAQMFGAPMRTY